MDTNLRGFRIQWQSLRDVALGNLIGCVLHLVKLKAHVLLLIHLVVSTCIVTQVNQTLPNGTRNTPNIVLLRLNPAANWKSIALAIYVIVWFLRWILLLKLLLLGGIYRAEIAWWVDQICEALHRRHTDILTVDRVAVSLALGEERWADDAAAGVMLRWLLVVLVQLHRDAIGEVRGRH